RSDRPNPKAGSGSAKPLMSAEKGEIIGWGTGQDSQAVKQTIRATEDLTPEKVTEMIAKGLDRTWVEQQLRMYNKALEKGGAKLKNKQLLHRKALMEKILRLWPR